MEEEEEDGEDGFVLLVLVWIDRSKPNPSLAKTLTAIVTPDTRYQLPGVRSVCTTMARVSRLSARGPEDTALTSCAARGIPPPTTPVLFAKVLVWAIFAFVLFMFCYLLLISSVVLVLPTASTFSQILSHIAFLWVMLVFLCCSVCLPLRLTPPIPWQSIWLCACGNSALRNAPSGPESSKPHFWASLDSSFK